ncbi:MAG: amidohydrolase family protein [Bryobacterales bacterium]|nr:amidohydrolase family protein [Bryobacterales bacterium]
MLKAVASLASRIPHLRIIIDHLPFDNDAQEALKPLHSQTNVFAKVSNVPRTVNGKVEEDPAYYHRVLDQLWNIFGPERLIYGSNWPVSARIAPYPVAWRLVKAYFESRGAAAAAGYFHGNAKVAYRWVER